MEPQPTIASVPFNKPFIVGKELFYISQAVISGRLAGDGSFTRRCERWIAHQTGSPRVLLTHSCTAALEMCALLANIGPGDEVILPSFTFVSTASAFVLRGATPRFVDIRPDTLNLDERLVEAAVTEKTRVIVPVHYAGVACEMASIMETAERHQLLVVEDAAQALLSKYHERPLGSIGHLGAFSFHETKNFISGEGGALSINDPQLIERAEILREKGTNRSKFFRGEIDKYTWVDLGSSFLPSEIVAAFLLAQLEEADTINRRRHEIYSWYSEALQPLADEGLVTLPHCPAHCTHNAHMFYLLLPNKEQRQALQAHLRERNIHAVFHYVPLHTSPMGKRFGYKGGTLPVTEDVSERLLRLPFFFGLRHEDQERIISEIFAFFGHERSVEVGPSNP